jgi:hypothetical protein
MDAARTDISLAARLSWHKAVKTAGAASSNAASLLGKTLGEGYWQHGLGHHVAPRPQRVGQPFEKRKQNGTTERNETKRDETKRKG